MPTRMNISYYQPDGRGAFHPWWLNFVNDPGVIAKVGRYFGANLARSEHNVELHMHYHLVVLARESVKDHWQVQFDSPEDAMLFVLKWS